MYYMIYCQDHNDSMAKRRSVRAAHLKRIEELKQQKRLLIAGPLLNQDQDVNLSFGVKGSLIIADFDDLETAKIWASSDPYVTASVWESISVLPFIAATDYQ